MIEIQHATCTGCGTCSLVCPHRVIDIDDRLARLKNEARCIECGACQLNCREGAITVTKGTGCLVAIARETWFNKPGQPGTCGEQEPGQPSCGCGCE